MSRTIKVEELPGLAGTNLEPSPWIEITQERVNQFADATNDHQFIHVDPVKAAETPFGGPIAHGFLSLSLLSYLNAQSAIVPENLAMVINYGSDKVRYLTPVRVGNAHSLAPEGSRRQREETRAVADQIRGRRSKSTARKHRHWWPKYCL